MLRYQEFWKSSKRPNNFLFSIIILFFVLIIVIEIYQDENMQYSSVHVCTKIHIKILILKTKLLKNCSILRKTQNRKSFECERRK